MIHVGCTGFRKKAVDQTNLPHAFNEAAALPSSPQNLSQQKSHHQAQTQPSKSAPFAPESTKIQAVPSPVRSPSRRLSGLLSGMSFSPSSKRQPSMFIPSPMKTSPMRPSREDIGSSDSSSSAEALLTREEVRRLIIQNCARLVAECDRLVFFVQNTFHDIGLTDPFVVFDGFCAKAAVPSVDVDLESLELLIEASNASIGSSWSQLFTALRMAPQALVQVLRRDFVRQIRNFWAGQVIVQTCR